MTHQLRAAAIHDISCMGRCSLTAALPILSAVGIETPVIPTAVLSTHTGGFSGYTYRDLTEDIMPIVDHWTTLNRPLNAIYTGFLGSVEQIEIVSRVFDKLKTKDTLIFVDPVMADFGKLYSVYKEDFPKEMKKLCRKADMIIPNITEACFLLDIPYQEGPYLQEFIISLMKKLHDEFSNATVILTGVYFNEDELGCACMLKDEEEISYIMGEKISGFYHGTGDVFASTLLAAMLKTNDLPKACRIAVDFTVEALSRTHNEQADVRFGVDFERGLLHLAQLLS